MNYNKMRRVAIGLLSAAVLSVSLTGCFFKSVDELYTPPQPSKEYEALQNQLSQVIAAGGEYAAPLSGEMIQSVQLHDLTGDGKKEAIAFFRFPGEEKPLRICIFRQSGEEYVPLVTVEGAGTAIYCVDYAQLDDSPCKELVVSWQMSSQLCSLAAYSIGRDGANELLRTDYTSYKLSDLDGDSQQELVVLRTPSGGTPQAEFYNCDGVLTMAGTAPLSGGITALANLGVRSGYLVDRVPGLFVTSTYGENGAITDVLVCREGKLHNVTLNGETGESGETIRFTTQVSERDINGDGILELPQPIPLLDYRVTSTTVNFWLVRWRQFDVGGKVYPIYTTYHNDRDGWYFVLPDSWEEKLVLNRSDMPGGGERSVTFSRWEGDEAVSPAPFLTIYKLTGTNRASRAKAAGRFILLEEGHGANGTIYAAEFRDGWDCGLTEDEVREGFHLIKTDWYTGY